MRCPYCKEDHDRVIDTRPSEEGYATRRRRECIACGRRYTTHERLEDMPLRVIKKNNQRVPFNRDKILSGVQLALQKRPVSAEQAEQMVDSIEREILESHEREISTREIGELVMKYLRDTDKVAYVRFASVYRDFKEIGEFLKEIDSFGPHDCSGEQNGGER